ncbi:MAG: hypothetical protein Q4C70_13105 [Planctomycetia bacterium]|nr:hypothetical protein [Planctomycetia bacterium]
MKTSIFHFSFLLLLFACFSGVSLAEDADGNGIKVTNYTDGTVIDYPVALIYGTLADESATEILCRNLTSSRSTKEISGSAYQGRFKVLAGIFQGRFRSVFCGV